MEGIVASSLLQISDEASDIAFIIQDDFASNLLKITFIFFTVFQFFLNFLFVTVRYIRMGESSLYYFQELKDFCKNFSLLALFLLSPFIFIGLIIAALILLIQLLWRTIIVWIKMDQLLKCCKPIRDLVTNFIYFQKNASDSLETEAIHLLNNIQEFIIEGMPHLIVQAINNFTQNDWTVIDIISIVLTFVDIMHMSYKMIYSYQKKDLINELKVQFYINTQVFALIFQFLCNAGQFLFNKCIEFCQSSYTFKLKIINIIFIASSQIFLSYLVVIDCIQYKTINNANYDTIVNLDETYDKPLIQIYKKKSICYDKQICFFCEFQNREDIQSQSKPIIVYSQSQDFSQIVIDDVEEHLYFQPCLDQVKDYQDDAYLDKIAECLNQFFQTIQDKKEWLIYLARWKYSDKKLTYFVYRKTVKATTYEDKLQIDDQTDQFFESFFKNIRFQLIKQDLTAYTQILLIQLIGFFIFILIGIILLCFANLRNNNIQFYKPQFNLGLFAHLLFFNVTEIIGFSKSKSQVEELGSQIDERYGNFQLGMPIAIFIFQIILIISIKVSN